MKKLLSIWTDRLLPLLFSAALLVSFLMPTQALAIVFMSSGGGGGGGMDGDPLDTNDAGGGGGGSDVQNGHSAGDSFLPPMLDLLGVNIVVVTDFVGGKMVLRFVVVERTDSDRVKMSLEETHAP